MCLVAAVNDVIGNSGVNNITMDWMPPANFSDDGTFSGYNLTCTSANETMINSFVFFPTKNYTFKLLKPFTNYKCCIEPHWITNGVGPKACIGKITQEDGNC